MNFNSIQFAIFLPIVFAIYWKLPNKYRTFILLIASLYFYMSWNPKYIVLILFTSTISYIAGRLIEKTEYVFVRKIILIIVCVMSLGLLFTFKYFNFFAENMIYILSKFSIQLHPFTVKLLLPVGISFYTFQTVSYVIDVYCKKINAEKNLFDFTTYITFFPQLVAGPIERSTNLLPQIKAEKTFDYNLAMHGMKEILWGLFKKIAIADILAKYVDIGYNNLQACGILDGWLIVVFFTLQIYCDFSGYSDIAIGTAKLFGIKLTTNFRSPYFSASVQEFWRRWHISLSSWLKDYLYIPMGGSRCSKLRQYKNIFLTFLMSGLWHGANWTFVIWGGVHGLAQIVERMLIKDNERNVIKRVISTIFVFLFINLAWVVFRATCLTDAVMLYRIIFGCINYNFLPLSLFATLGINSILVCRIVVSIILVIIVDYISLKTNVFDTLSNCSKLTNVILGYLLIILIMWSLYDNMGNTTQFVYFQF